MKTAKEVKLELGRNSCGVLSCPIITHDLGTDYNQFLEKSIDAKLVIMDAPANGTVLANYNENIHWQPLNGAFSYKLRLVTPAFITAQNFLFETIVVRSNFTSTLNLEAFQWSSRALYASSQTAYTKALLRNDTSSFCGLVTNLDTRTQYDTSRISTILFFGTPLFISAQCLVQNDSINFNLTENSKAMVDSILFITSLYYLAKTNITNYWQEQPTDSANHSKFSAVLSFKNDTDFGVDTVILSRPVCAAENAIRLILLTWKSFKGHGDYEFYIFKGKTLVSFSGVSDSQLANVFSYSFKEGYIHDAVHLSVSALNGKSKVIGNQESDNRFFVISQ